MIDIKTLRTPDDIGRWVEYVDGMGNVDHGRLKGWNDKYVFVVFKCDDSWHRFLDYTGQSCDPADVSFQ